MEEKRELLNEAKKELEGLENSGASKREIDKMNGKIWTLEADHQKARKNYDSIVQAEAEEIQVIKDLESEYLEEEEIVNNEKMIETINRQQAALKSRIQKDIHISENPKESEECWKESRERLERNKATYEQSQEEKKELLELVGKKNPVLQKELEALRKEDKGLDQLIESDKQIAADSTPYEVEAAKKKNRAA